MSYIDKHLLSGEQIVARVRPHWILLAGPAVAALVAAFFVGYTIRWPRSALDAEAWTASRLGLVVAGIALVARIVHWMSAECVLTDKRLVVMTGWLRRDLVELRLSKIEGVQLHQGIVGRLLGYATLMVKGLGGTRELHPNIVAPVTFHQAIRRQLDLHA